MHDGFSVLPTDLCVLLSVLPAVPAPVRAREHNTRELSLVIVTSN